MTAPLYSWEKELAKLAQPHPFFADAAPAKNTHADASLQSAFSYCEAIIRKNSRSFFLASGLLPKEKKRDIRALYAFCRHTDDLIDLEHPAQASAYSRWKTRVLSDHLQSADPLLMAWRDVQNRYHIPPAYVEQFLNGVALDTQKTEYASFEELAYYCYGVASTVGLMSMCIIGCQDPGAVTYAIRLGVALQMTNILRDVAEDWTLGRLYLPLNELHSFGLSKTDIAESVSSGRLPARWPRFMRFQIHRARKLYQDASPGYAMLNPDGRFAIASAAAIYAGILDDIEAHAYDVFTRRAFVSDWKKMTGLPRIFFSTRFRAASS